jgi:hypothetical protein
MILKKRKKNLSKQKEPNNPRMKSQKLLTRKRKSPRANLLKRKEEKAKKKLKRRKNDKKND